MTLAFRGQTEKTEWVASVGWRKYTPTSVGFLRGKHGRILCRRGAKPKNRSKGQVKISS